MAYFLDGQLTIGYLTHMEVFGGYDDSTDDIQEAARYLEDFLSTGSGRRRGRGRMNARSAYNRYRAQAAVLRTSVAESSSAVAELARSYDAPGNSSGSRGSRGGRAGTRSARAAEKAAVRRAVVRRVVRVVVLRR